MPVLAVHNNLYKVEQSLIPVTWAEYDFKEDVVAIPDLPLQKTLYEVGVMYVPAGTPPIRVSHLLGADIQGLSALHEEICMNQKTAECPEVEGMVIDSLKDNALRAEYISVRSRLFGALCLMNPTNELFVATSLLLSEKSTV